MLQRAILPSITLFALLLLPSCMMLSPWHYGQRGQDRQGPEIRRDYVCGKVIADDIEAYVYPYRGTLYYFDSKECLEDFRTDPDRHVSEWQNGIDEDHRTSNALYWAAGVVGMTALMFLMMRW